MSLGEHGTRRLDAGDGLRAVAMLSVFVLHVFLDAAPGARPDPDWADWGPLGQALSHLDLGLSLFFVLSGYLIARPFARAFVLGRSVPSIGRYARNRALRILPVYWVVVALVLLVFGTRGSTFTEVLAVLAVQDLYVGAEAGFPVAVSWTLSTEVAFYATVPLLALVGVLAGRVLRPGMPRAIAATVGLLALTAFSLRWRHYAETTELARLNNPLGIFWAFSPGVVLAVVEPVIAPVARRMPTATARLGVLLLLAGGVSLAAYVALEPYGYVALHHVRAPQALAAAAFAGSVLAGVVLLQLAGRRARVLGHPVMVWLGERSYPFYLLHFAVLVGLADVIGDDASRATYALVGGVVGFPVTLALAHLAHVVVERPFLERRSAVSAPDVPPPGPSVTPPDRESARRSEPVAEVPA